MCKRRLLPTAPTPVGLYVHVPYCPRKCGYCDFYSVPIAGEATNAYVEAMLAELAGRWAREPMTARTCFIGGGTPTALPADQLRRLLTGVRDVAQLPAGIEWTVEANPGTVDETQATVLAEAGVNRVSLGAQSFEPAELRVLDREHEPAAVRASLEALRRVGIANLSLDLIFGVPGQTEASWARSLAAAVSLGVQHISCYGLTYEPGTPMTGRLVRGELTRCDEPLEAALFEQTLDTLSAAGFEAYEISNYAQPGRRCAHNLIYWHNEPYLGVGPSAAGCVGRRRYRNVADVAEYVARAQAGQPVEAEIEQLGDEAVMHELLLMQLRLAEGVSRSVFRDRTGHDPATLLEGPVARLTDAGLLQVSDTHLSLTRAGRLVGDAVILELAAACPGADQPVSHSGAPSARCPRRDSR